MKTKQLWKYIDPIIYFLEVVVVSCHIYSCEKISLWCGNILSLVWKCFAPAVVCTSGSSVLPLDHQGSVYWLLLRLQQNAARHGRKLSKLMWKYFVSGVDIFRLQCGHFSFSFLSYNRNEKCPHNRRKISIPETTNFLPQRHHIFTPWTKYFHNITDK